ncbi:YcaO-like family protein [Thermomonospora cellulosilytica]|uniref:Ribosomal protein S12 methylthiotransferase accessory factor n=1 Tax=Thermomonospora cellulosilytica TaxID=1411118 RepID=A0A7W3N2H6_9ACTN|nr:YcaO-like family protein [Thermomonospora cellulosilytica]MBA9006312.1 ribosomal protein S12 methylthiotransferase accessory factor [Thermomonospora cellulosilytica]
MHGRSLAPTGPSAPPASAKVTSVGTHRVRPAEETWEWIRPILPRCGITRVADVTWLDEIGIPVFQAVRPNARTLSVSQGKGATAMLARVSAAMEAVELWHAEHPRVPVTTATVEEIEGELGYPLDALPLAPRHFVGPDCRFGWYPAARIDGAGTSYLPSSLLHLDSCVTGRWTPAAFRATSNGLASGNVLDEALLHGLYEVVERDAAARARRHGTGRPLDLSTVHDPTARMLLERLTSAGIHVTARFLPSPFGIPTFDAVITSSMFPVPFGGVGTHLDAGIALCRALTEAAQSRATAIAGTRDDLGQTPYREAHFSLVNRSPSPPLPGRDAVDFASVVSAPLPDVRQEVVHVARRIESVMGHPPLYVDLTRPELGIPVAHVVCPGALIDISH